MGIWILIITTRFLLLSPNALFFDSPEYLGSIKNPSLFAGLTEGHYPTHIIFILINWLVGRVISPPLSGSLISAVFGVGSIIILYLLTKIIVGRKVAKKTILIFSFLPYVWITQTNFTIESMLIFFFLSSYYFFYLYLRGNQVNKFLLALLFFSSALLTHFSIFIFAASFFSLLTLFPNKRIVLTKTLLLIIFSLLLSVFTYVFVFYLAGNLNQETIQASFIAHLGERVDLLNFPTGTARFFRNLSIIALRSLSPGVVIVFILALKKYLVKENSFFWFITIFSLPYFISSQYWHVGLFGRTSILIAIPISIAIANYLKKKTFLFLLLSYLILSYLPIISRYKSNIQPIYELQKLQYNLKKGGLYFDSHLARPFTIYEGQVLHIGHTAYEEQKRNINAYLKEGRPVYIDSLATYDPYLSYDATTLHILGLGKFGVSDSQQIYENNPISMVAFGNSSERIFVNILEKSSVSNYSYIKNSPNLAVITGKGAPGTPVLIYSDKLSNKILTQRLDYYDPITWIWVIIFGREEPIAWTYSDRDGNFIIPVKKDDVKHIYVKGKDVKSANLSVDSINTLPVKIIR